MRAPSVPRLVLLGTGVGSILLGAGGFALGRVLGHQDTPGAVPVRAVPAADPADPIVVPARLEVPRG